MKYLFLFFASLFISNCLDYLIWKPLDTWLFLYIGLSYLYTKWTYEKLIEEEAEHEQNS